MSELRLRRRRCTVTGRHPWQVTGTALWLRRTADGGWTVEHMVGHGHYREVTGWLLDVGLHRRRLGSLREARQVLEALLEAFPPPPELRAPAAVRLCRHKDGWQSADGAWKVERAPGGGWSLSPATEAAARRVANYPRGLDVRAHPRTLHEAAQHIAELDRLL